MKRRWLIRAIFITLLTLSLTGWVFSALYFCTASLWRGHREIKVMTAQGGVCFHSIRYNGSVTGNHWNYFCCYYPTQFWPAYSVKRNSGWGFYFFGFGYSHSDRLSYKVMAFNQTVTLPFWFFILLSAAGLWFVWRKTRPKLDPRTAFPVEVNPTPLPHSPGFSRDRRAYDDTT
ncbi:MAG: hypothetical protein FWD53_00270 [Phycisphaerales bacterium]|nr:hypothetical protein [Phycisphaerales bacterium]